MQTHYRSKAHGNGHLAQQARDRIPAHHGLGELAGEVGDEPQLGDVEQGCMIVAIRWRAVTGSDGGGGGGGGGGWGAEPSRLERPMIWPMGRPPPASSKGPRLPQ